MIVDQEREQWQIWLKNRALTARDWLFVHYHPWSKQEAQSWQRKLFLSLADVDDFRQYASIGLLEAIGHFNPRLGFKFVLFARFRVKGAILNQVFRFSDESAQLQAAYSRDELLPSILESSAQPLQDLTLSIENLATSFLLTDTVHEHPQSWINGDYYSSTEISCLKIRYMDQLLRLEDPMQSIMLFRYLLDWDFIVIADTLGFSKGRISQLHKEAIDLLRNTKPQPIKVEEADFYQSTGIPA